MELLLRMAKIDGRSHSVDSERVGQTPRSLIAYIVEHEIQVGECLNRNEKQRKIHCGSHLVDFERIGQTSSALITDSVDLKIQNDQCLAREIEFLPAHLSRLFLSLD